MNIFLKRILHFSAVPIGLFLILIVLYVNTDPYSDFGKKDNYSWKFFFQQLGDLSTKKLLNSTTNYNSFIFGSSRTSDLYACYLEKKIPGSKFFHYGNWNETIGGIYSKLNLIDSCGYNIDNAFVYLDTDFTFGGDGKVNPADHYLLTGESKFSYLFGHFKSYFQNITMDKIKILLGMPVSGDFYPNWESDLTTNDPKHSCNDTNHIYNYSKKDVSNSLKHKIDSLKEDGFLYSRSPEQQYCQAQISDTEKVILMKIYEIFMKHDTQYHIVITPLYDQKKFHPCDKQILNDFFKNRIIDFSGINQFTNDEYNYPDRKHFQPYISKSIVDSIFRISQ